LEYANKAGFLAITKVGAAPSSPFPHEIEAVFK
jgi:sugar/nucleoside kinase (ribokinase family)